MPRTDRDAHAFIDGNKRIAAAGGALISVGCHGVSTESGSDRVSVISKIRIANYCYPVATALGTDLITILGHHSAAITETFLESNGSELTMTNNEVVQLFLTIAAGPLTREDVENQLRSNTRSN